MTTQSSTPDTLHHRLVNFTITATARKHRAMVADGECSAAEMASLIAQRRVKLAGLTAQRIAERLLIDLPADEFHRC